MTRRICITFVLLLASFPAVELLFRGLGDTPSSDLQGLFSPSLESSYKLAPNVATYAKWLSGEFSVHTDPLGLRCDSERKFALEPNVRIDALILGDSQGFGNGLSFEDTVAGSMIETGNLLNLKVANASVGGHAARNQLALAKWLSSKHNITANTYIIFATPLMVMYSSGFKTNFVGDDGRLYEGPIRLSTKLRLWARTQTVVYGRLRDAVRNAGIGKRPAEDQDQVFQLFGSKDSAEASSNFSQFLREVQEFVTTRNAKLIVVYVPLTVEADFTVMESEGSRRGYMLDPNRPARILLKAAQSLGVPAYDLRPVLRSLHEQGEPLRLKGDFHYDRSLSKACGVWLWDAVMPHLSDKKIKNI